MQKLKVLEKSKNGRNRGLSSHEIYVQKKGLTDNQGNPLGQLFAEHSPSYATMKKRDTEFKPHRDSLEDQP